MKPSMQLVIAEKPSVARSIAGVLGATQKQNGYLEGNGYMVSWCIGHLVELAAPQVYDEKYAKWQATDLPILPTRWQYTISERTKAQYGILKKLMLDPKLDTIICATDAGREGELIFRFVYETSGCSTPIQRLWISSMEEKAIREGFQSLKPASEYDRLYQAALCRAQADWLVGLNATRLFSTLYGQTLHIGRVMTPTLAMLVSREAQIAAFQPTPFYHVHLDYNGFSAQSQRFMSREDAERTAALCHGKEATITTQRTKAKTENPPMLYDLTSLQREANRLLGYTAQQTLDYAQTLYEKKLCTYPRTDSRYITTHMEGSIQTMPTMLAALLPFSIPGDAPCDITRIVEDSKVTDHHAILPTESAANMDLQTLTAGERNVLILLIVRLLCAVHRPCLTEETTISIDCAGIPFTAKGTQTVDGGWREMDAAYRKAIQSKADKDEAEGSPLPKVEDGMVIPAVAAAIKEGQTAPPKHYTEDTLLAAMETAGQLENPEADMPHKGIGTPATRAGILEKLIKVGFVSRKKVKKCTILLPSDKANALITVLPEELQSPSMTAEWEYQLGQIEKGELEMERFMQGIKQMVQALTSHTSPIKDAHVLFPKDEKTIGRCPRCGNAVTENPKGFSCANRGCKFMMWKDNRFFTSKRTKLTAAMAMALLCDGSVPASGLYSEKTGKTYDATILLDDTGDGYVNYKLAF